MRPGRLLVPGWRLIDETGHHSQLIFVGYPHTSRWDFALTQAVRLATGRRLLTLVTESEFVGVRRWMLRLLGCRPLPLQGGAGTVDRLVRFMAIHPSTSLALCPEGRIEWSPHWRTGYFILGLVTGIPVSYVTFDYARRVVTLGSPVQVVGDPVIDLAYAARALRAGHGFRPGDAGRVMFSEAWKVDLERLQAQQLLWDATRNGFRGSGPQPG